MKLFSWGANTYSQLGQGVTSEHCVVPLEVGVEGLNLSTVVAICGGGGHTLVLCSDGALFGCGWNNKSQLGLTPECRPMRLSKLSVPSNLGIGQIACGWDYSMAVTSGGNVWTWGSNAYGQLGFNKAQISRCMEPLEVPAPGIKQVACGLRHTAMTTLDGHVVVCGSGRKGQLGLTDSGGLPLMEADGPHIVPGLSQVESVSCGQHHTIAVTASGQVFVWGENRHGQLGVDSTLLPIVSQPLEIHPLPKEQISTGCKVQCGWTHTTLLTETGDIFNWGRNSYGQLGCFEYQRPVPWMPQRLESVNRVKQLAVGAEHNVALLDSGQLVSWGWNEHGNCGTGTEVDVIVPTRVALEVEHKSVLVGGGMGHTFTLVDTS